MQNKTCRQNRKYNANKHERKEMSHHNLATKQRTSNDTQAMAGENPEGVRAMWGRQVHATASESAERSHWRSAAAAAPNQHTR